VTSPPYWGLRDYGVENQLGLESSPIEYIEKLTTIFSEVRRVLKPRGTMWLNLGDTYASSGGAGHQGKHGERYNRTHTQRKIISTTAKDIGIKEKNLCGIPWRVALSLQQEGWNLRQDIIWSKPNPIPESVRDRCTKSHEYIFLMTKEAHYYFDHESMQEKAVDKRGPGNKISPRIPPGERTGENANIRSSLHKTGVRQTRNRRSVWTVSTKPFKGAHFAVFPPDLIIPCIRAGCPPGGIVLDPFMGSGTTGIVARAYNRSFIGIDVSAKYCELAKRRIGQ
jgi:DNA modification methylase